jgi:hypothetical protein
MRASELSLSASVWPDRVVRVTGQRVGQSADQPGLENNPVEGCFLPPFEFAFGSSGLCRSAPGGARHQLVEEAADCAFTRRFRQALPASAFEHDHRDEDVVLSKRKIAVGRASTRWSSTKMRRW